MNLSAGRAQTAMFTASEVEAQTGVPATTLRQWERRYGFPCPERSANGYRLYSPHDVAAIQRMQAHLNAGVPASRAAELTQRDAQEPASSGPDLHDTAEWSRQLTQALVSADTSHAASLLGQVHAHLPVEDVLTHVISPTLTAIGQLWERGEITVAHEHQASAFLRSRLSHLMDMAGAQEGFGPLVVAACAPAESHELGLMMLTLALRRRGVRVAYLGANVPLGDLAVFTRQQGARAVLLALNGDWALGPTREHLRDLAGLDVPVFMGGALLNRRPELARELGAEYAGPDAPRAAQQIAARLHQGGHP